MESQRNLLVIGLLVVSYLLWQQWQTDKAPKPGEFHYFTQGVKLQGQKVVLFTLMSNDKDGAVLKQAFPVIRPRGTIVQVGVTGSADIPVNALVGKEIKLVGTHRFHQEYAVAAKLIREQRIDVRPVISSTIPMERIAEAFSVVRDRSSQMKVILSFD